MHLGINQRLFHFGSKEFSLWQVELIVNTTYLDII